MTIDDATLVAFADGELDDEETARVHAALENDPALWRRLRQFETSAELLREAFEDQLRVPVPRRFELLLDAPHRPRERESWRSYAAPLVAFITSAPGRACAAALTLMLGAVVGHLATESRPAAEPSAPVPELYALPAWHDGFETTPSGTAFTVSRDASARAQRLVPLSTFLDLRDRYCRAFSEERAEALLARRGVVCREPDGRWMPVLTVAEVKASPAHTGASHAQRRDGVAAGGYRPASGPGGDTFEQGLQQHMATSPFEPTEERALIDGGWRRGMQH